MNPAVSILILNFNGKDYLASCLNSVIAQSFTDFEIIVFDNGSNDGSSRYVKENFRDSRIKLVESDKNLGFAGGNNKALEHASGELIVLLNNDTIADKDWLKELAGFMSTAENAGLVQSLVRTAGIPEKFYRMNGTINLLGHNIMEVFPIEENGTGEILLANGCSLIMKKNTAERLGGMFLDEYFSYAEDTFLSLRVKFLGLNNYHTSRSVVSHYGSSSAINFQNSFTTFCQERNRILNFLLLFSPSFILKIIPYLASNFFFKLLSSPFTKYSLTGIFRAYFWILTNPGWINKKRKELRVKNITVENEVLKYISCKMLNGEGTLSRFVNGLSLIYCRVVRLMVHENS